MFHLQRAFENSLRSGDVFSPNSPKNRISAQHKSCKGTIHGSGNYFKTTTSSDSTKPPLNSHQKQKKSSSISSEGFSESDSLDSINEKKLEDTQKSTCDRLHAASTKASHAKTAQMRHLDTPDAFYRENSFKRRNSFRKTAEKPSQTAKKPEKLTKTDAVRNSFRRVIKKSKLSKIECVSWEEVHARNSNRKPNCNDFNDKNGYYKAFDCFQKAISDQKPEVRPDYFGLNTRNSLLFGSRFGKTGFN